MAVWPYTWVSWSDARSRMPEIWQGWRFNWDHADRAMVNSLRRGNVPYRGEAEDRVWLTRIPLQDVVSGLLSVSVGGIAEYEKAEISGGFQLGRFQTPPRPVMQKKTAQLVQVELAWEEFRDDLIRYELPAGVTPTPTRQPRKAPTGKATKLDVVRAFLAKKYPGGLPAGLSNKQIARDVSRDKKVSISDRTVRRARSE